MASQRNRGCVGQLFISIFPADHLEEGGVTSMAPRPSLFSPRAFPLRPWRLCERIVFLSSFPLAIANGAGYSSSVFKIGALSHCFLLAKFFAFKPKAGE